jgi:hypothetical protein
VLTEVTTDMVITKEETFGPVSPLYRFMTDAEAIKMANACCAAIEGDSASQIVYTVAMAEKPKPDPNVDLHRILNNACRKWGAREIRLRYLPKPSLNRWIAEALIDHHRVIEKIRADIPAGELTLQDVRP